MSAPRGWFGLGDWLAIGLMATAVAAQRPARAQGPLTAQPVPPAAAQPAAPPTPAAAAADPWATMRGCMKVLERFARCGRDKHFEAYQTRWLAASAPGPKAAPKEVARRLRSWIRHPGRRAQCATWSRRAGAPEHIGEGSPLHRLAASGGAITCAEYAGKLDEDRWVPIALIDARPD